MKLTGTRTAKDYASTINWLCDELYPGAKKIMLVQDNLNTHTPPHLINKRVKKMVRTKILTNWPPSAPLRVILGQVCISFPGAPHEGMGCGDDVLREGRDREMALERLAESSEEKDWRWRNADGVHGAGL